MEFNAVAAGIGGQGIVRFSEILARAMIREGLNASFYVHSGLAQLGGSVRSHIRCGSRICPKISEGCADVILSLEMAEILHAFPYLKRGGKALISEEVRRPYHASVDPSRYPTREQIEGLFEGADAQVVFLPAPRLAREAGHVQSQNIAVLGSLVAMTGVVDTESAVVAIRETIAKGADVNVEAFWKGYAFINGKDYV